MGILQKIKNMRGALYRKLFKKEIPPAPPKKTRAGQMLTILRGEPREEKKEVVKKLKIKKEKRKYPEFKIIPSKSFITVFRPDKNRSLRYALIRPYAYASIRWDIKRNSIVYHVIEPPLNDDERAILEKLKEGLIQTINVDFTSVKKGKEFLEESVERILDELGFELTDHQYLTIMYYIYRDFIGLNEIEPLLHDPYIEDISCDGVGIPIYVVHQKLGSLETNIVYNDENKLKSLIVKLAERCDRYISYAEPLLDGALPDGSRVQASLAGDVTTRGPTFTIRKFREKPFTPVDMVELGTADPHMLAYLWFVVEQGVNILICGGVATGKTSFLNNLSLFIPPDAKIVSIEDTRELNLPHENWVPAVSRAGFTGTKTGEVDMFELLKESFRQNPDYLIVGEVRGKEAFVMFQGMASGHPAISTIHAGDVEDVIKRLETAPINLSPSLVNTLDIVIVMTHAREKGKSARRVKKIVEIEQVDATGRAKTHIAFSWDPSTDRFIYNGSNLIEKIAEERGIPKEKAFLEIELRKKVIEWLVKNKPAEWKDIVKYITYFYRDKEKLLKMIQTKQSKT